ncbi:spermatid-specific linker histone H1-like protein isoform X2 [Choloepus didactylus]|nr:spermatid-specific linker histone H1-like protein isoform X2 [Choloepus didactylus]
MRVPKSGCEPDNGPGDKTLGEGSPCPWKKAGPCLAGSSDPYPRRDSALCRSTGTNLLRPAVGDPRGRRGLEPHKEASEGTKDPGRAAPTHQGADLWTLLAATLEVLSPSSLHPPQEEMQKETSLLPPTSPLGSNTALGAGQLASMSGVPSKTEAGRHACPRAQKKPSMSKVILRTVEGKGTRNCVSLATLKKAVATTGYDMACNAWRFKRVLKGLVDKGMLKQVSGKGASGSFRMGKKHASKLKAKKRQQRRRQTRRHQPGKRQLGQRQLGQRRPGQQRLLMGSKQGHKRLTKGVRRGAKCRCN